ncbi:MarR family winged helix-turn-helix transcriptional regulator [Prosthecomicrobium pneumaticum]|uniref:MarR family winged helix-turn-helix transcriptional regulator n=1 Tax=Prosthecomicrobium pneumaticum TaxID=81895 RepID=UPI00160FA2E9|nr:MarR family transcriptional regulator [Prosthecomicrobium pneumaticum]
MADVNFVADASDPEASSSAPPIAEPLTREAIPEVALIELLFFAYRDFVSDPDAVLEDFGFGRAHHRVVHFVNRNPGIRVADLLDILKITKQSLGRVLKELVDTGFVEQRPGPVDRRQRLLYPTQKGRALAERLIEPQARRIAAALDALDPKERAGAEHFLRLVVDPADRDAVARLTAR